MKRTAIICGLLFGLLGAAPAQDLIGGKVIRIRVNHADPWFIVAMLEGWNPMSPELSTIFNAIGAPQAGTALNRLFKGKFIVNPTDNSILFFPDPGTQ